MLSDGTYTGVVDRFEEDATGEELAVILLEDDGEVFEQVDVPWAELPPEIGQDTVCGVRVEDGDVVDVAVRQGEMKEREERAQNRFDSLAERPDVDSDDE